MRAIWPGALLVVYLSATGMVLLVGHARVFSGGVLVHFAILAATAAATFVQPFPRWLRTWTPLLALFFLYTEMPMLIRAAGHDAVYDSAIMDWESALFGSQPALEWAARWPSRAVSEVLHLAYLAYYPIIFIVPAVLYARSRYVEFGEAVFVLMLTYVTCFAWYLVFPVAGPRYFAAPAASAGPIRSLVTWLLEARSSRGTAFPSSHVAVAVTQSVLAIRYFGTRGAPVAIVSVGLAAGAIYGGFHYAIDVVAGVLVGALATMLALSLMAWTSHARSRQANATAPT